MNDRWEVELLLLDFIEYVRQHGLDDKRLHDLAYDFLDKEYPPDEEEEDELEEENV